MRLILCMLMILGLAWPAAAEDGDWSAIAVGQWREGNTLYARATSAERFATESEAEQEAVAHCYREGGAFCEAYTSWNEGCRYATINFVRAGEPAWVFSATTKGEALAQCYEANALGCGNEEPVGGCAPGWSNDEDIELDD